MDIGELIQELMSRIPDGQKLAASTLLAEYGPRLFELTQTDAWQYLRRLLAGDLTAMVELDAQLSDDDFLARVRENTARWQSVARYNKVREDLKNEILLRTAPIVVSILLALVGL